MSDGKSIPIDKEGYENTLNEILPGLTMYVRDVNLPPACAEKYRLGLIIMERGFTDASNRVMGMTASHRYAILSNHMSDFRPFEHGTNWGLFVARNNAHFKVLDVYEYRGKTQILLLHLPDDPRWKLFENMTFSLEEQLIRDSRSRFENKSALEAVPELAKEDWMARCASPLGMDREGRLYDTEPLLQSEMHPVKGAGFRSFYHRFVYLQSPDLAEKLGEEFLAGEDAGVIACGLVDQRGRLSFPVVKLAAVRENRLRMRDPSRKDLPPLLPPALERAWYLDLRVTETEKSVLEELEKKLPPAFAPRDPATEKLRAMEFLDESRHPEYPDVLSVLLLSGEKARERVWVRGSRLTEHEIFGELLQKPKGDFGVGHGDEIRIVPWRSEDGRVICISHPGK